MRKNPSSMGYKRVSFREFQHDVNVAVRDYQRERGLDRNFHPLKKGFVLCKKCSKGKHHAYMKVKGGLKK